MDTKKNAVSLKRKKGHQQLSYLVFVLWTTFVVSNLPKHVLEVVYGLSSNRVSMDVAYQREQTFMCILVFSWSIYLVTPLVYFLLYRRLLLHELKRSDTVEWVSSTCFRWKNNPKNSQQRQSTKTPFKITQKSVDDFEVDYGNHMYILPFVNMKIVFKHRKKTLIVIYF